MHTNIEWLRFIVSILNTQMRLYLCFGIVFTQIITLNSMRNEKNIFAVKDPIKETDAVFSSVIHNITNINKVLRDLINDYKYLQNVYKSQEITSDEETDEGFKYSKRSKNDKTTVTTKKYGITEIIWEDSNGDKNDSETLEKPDSGKEQYNSNTKETEGEQNQSNIFFTEIHKGHKKEVTDDKLEPILTAKTPDGSKMHKTRYSKVSNEQEESSNDQNSENNMHKQSSMSYEADDIGSRQNLENVKLNENSLRIKKPVVKKLYSETFSAKTILDEIINNKPIKLEAHYEKSLTGIRNNRNKHFVHRSGKSIYTNNLKKEILDSDTESTEADISTSKDELRASVLRHAYGDACLKLVVRKCYKALKRVNKEMCTRFKCKSGYKEKFLDYSKKGCISEFTGNDTKNYDNIFYRENSIRLDINVSGTYNDFTRGGYVHACLPHLDPGLKEKGNNKNKNKEWKAKPEKGKAIRISSNDTTLTSPDTSDINTLRDRFEKACKKTSTIKCTAACTYASKHICESFVCSNTKKRAYRKTCKRQCKDAYRSYGGISGSDSSSSSSSDDDSDSSS